MAFADLTARLQLNISDFTSKMTQASKSMNSFSTRMNKQYGDAAKSLTAHNMGLKDTRRIVQGIVVAQTFYSGARAIREATSALLGFNEALDYAQVTYSALFGSTKVATDFMSVLQEHSIETIFDYQQLADASKKLLAYGIEYKNLMFIMEGLTNLGAMSGDAAALDRISLALGQIYTRGKLTAEEMRQLANAYVPIADIIQEKFNLTPDQMGKVGDLNLPAHEVINAVVDYANERFGDVGDAAMYTITGLKNRIVDTFKVLGVEMMAPLTRAFKSFLMYTSKGLEGVRNAFTKKGTGGILDALVPNEDTQKVIRQFLANVRNLFMTIMSLGSIAGQVIKNFGYVFVTAFNMVTPVVTTFVNLMAKVVHSMLETRTGATILRIALLAAAGAFVVIKTHAIGALVITAVTKAVMGLSKALLLLSAIVTKHLILSLLAGLAIALVGVSVTSNSANKGLSSLFDTLSGAGSGASSSDMLKDVNKQLGNSVDAAEQFNNRLGDGKDAADALGDSIDKAGKKAKKTGDLLSFDEVYKLKDNNSSEDGGGTGGGIADDIDGLISGLGGLGDALIPDIPDFSEFVEDYTDSLFGGLLDGIKESILGKAALAGIGTLLANKVLKSLDAVKLDSKNASILKLATNIVTAIKGGFVGIAVDAIISPFTDKLWNFLEESLELEGSARKASIGATIGSVIGGAIGMLVGGLPGSLIGTAIGHLAGGIAGLLWDEIQGALSNTVVDLGAGIAAALAKAWGGSFSQVLTLLDFSSFKGFFSSLAGIFKGAGLKAIAKGGVIGMAVGFITDGIAALLWDTLDKKFEGADPAKAKVGQTIGSVIGTVIGGIFFGPVGAVIGSAIGTFAGGLVGLFWDKISGFFVKSFKIVVDWGKDIGKSISNWWSDTKKGFSNWWKDTKDGFSEWWKDTKQGFSDWYSNTKTKISTWWKDIKQGFSDWYSNTKTKISTWWKDTKQGFSDWYSNTKTKISTWWSETKSGFSNWWSNTKQGFSDWWSNVKTGFSDWYSNTKTKISNWLNENMSGLVDWWSNTKQGFSDWWSNTKQGFSDWYSNTKTKISNWLNENMSGLVNWWSNTKQGFSDWWSNVKTGFSDWYSNTKTKISNWWSETKSGFSNWWSNTKQGFSDWWSNVKTGFSDWYSNTKTKISDWWKEVKEGFSDWYSNTKTKLSNWWSETKSGFANWCSETSSSVSTWFKNLIPNIKSWWEKLWDPETWTRGWELVKKWFTDLVDDITKWFTNFGPNIKKLWDGLWSGIGKAGGAVVDVVTGPTRNGPTKTGHANGGIFNREHIARFAEGNKAEAIIPLENGRAMQPFVDAVSNGLIGSLAPLVASRGTSAAEQLPPLYVGTLIADERGLEQLYKKFEVINLKENARRGTPGGPFASPTS